MAAKDGNRAERFLDKQKEGGGEVGRTTPAKKKGIKGCCCGIFTSQAQFGFASFLALKMFSLLLEENYAVERAILVLWHAKRRKDL